MLAEARPDDAVLGEEEGAVGTGTRRWIVDPIDGTRNYSRGIPVWATLIALEEDAVVRVGVVSAPALRGRWWAERGAGAFANGEPMHVSAVATVEEAVLSFSIENDVPRARAARVACARPRRFLGAHARCRRRRRWSRRRSRCQRVGPRRRRR